MAKKEKKPPKEVRIERYKASRFWGVWIGETLLAVTVYKRGAEAVAIITRELIRRTPSGSICATLKYENKTGSQSI